MTCATSEEVIEIAAQISSCESSQIPYPIDEKLRIYDAVFLFELTKKLRRWFRSMSGRKPCVKHYFRLNVNRSIEPEILAFRQLNLFFINCNILWFSSEFFVMVVAVRLIPVPDCLPGSIDAEEHTERVANLDTTVRTRKESKKVSSHCLLTSIGHPSRTTIRSAVLYVNRQVIVLGWECNGITEIQTTRAPRQRDGQRGEPMPVETVDPDEFRPGEMVGTAVQRREDRRHLTGQARYTDDIQHPGTCYLALLGSRYGHARVESIDTSGAEAAENVVGVYTHEDLVDAGLAGTMPGAKMDAEDLEGDASGHEDIEIKQPLLADDRVRYQGQPVAAVVAEERYAAFDALDRIDVAYERLDAVVEMEDARTGDAPVIHDAFPNNVAFEWETGDEAETKAAFGRAAHTVTLEVGNNRVIPTALEPRAAVARYRSSDDHLTVELSSQNPHAVQDRLVDVLDIPKHRVTVRVPDVGGGFGAKLQPYSGHLLAAWCATQLERPVKWQARRTDDFQSMVHARRQGTTIEAALDEDGHILGLYGHIHADLGGYPTNGGIGIPQGTAGMLCGAYDVDAAHMTVNGVVTNTAPISAYRGAGRPEAAYIVERLARVCARELAMDPAEFRRRNFIDPDDFPHQTPLAVIYDSGDYERALDAALQHVGYEEFRERQERLREAGRYVGIGLSSYVEICGGAPGSIESGHLRVTSDGQVIVHTGTQDTGQGHETSYAQLAAAELGVAYDEVKVVEGDTDRVPDEGGGTAGSRSLPMAGNAVRKGAERIIEKARSIAAHHLEATVADIEYTDGEFHIAGASSRSMSFREIASFAYDASALPDDIDPGLEASTFFEPSGATAPFGTHVAVVEVDPETGEMTIEQFVAVDDVGPQVNPKLVEGQIVGGIAQGIGQACLEDGQYDGNGNLVTASLQDYAIPKSEDVPDVTWDSTVTPSPNNPLGVKGVGEAGTIGSTPAVVNAALDALEPLGVEGLEMPLSNETIWRAIEESD